MNGAESAHEVWLNALLDAQTDVIGKIATAELAQIGPSAHSDALVKLTRLQQSFAQLHDSATQVIDPQLRFNWRHLAVLDRLGAGGYGEVFRAYDSVLEREVALKLRRANNQFSAAAGRAFIDEARRLAQVRHPNVLAVHGAAVDQARAGIWTDLLIGETLASRITRDGPMPFPALLTLTTDLAAALSAVHAQAIVHGDLKPANVMCEAGQNAAYVLMDFGAGAQLDGGGQTRLFAGTRNFMAPEHLAGELLGTGIDIFALGATIYFAATACVLPSADAPIRIALKSLRARKELPTSFIALLTRLVAAQPSDRPSAAEISACCQALVGAPERRKRLRLRFSLFAISFAALIAITSAVVLTVRAQAAIEVEADRATATKDFLLSMMRNSNPYQSPNPTRSVAAFFENAVAELPSAFANDPQTQAQLLNQFGITLQSLDRDDSAMRALIRADKLLASIVPPTDPDRIAAMAYLSRSYRIRGDNAKARQLTDMQAKLCESPTVLSSRECAGILNDQAFQYNFVGDNIRALALIKQILVRTADAPAAADRIAYTFVIQGTAFRQLGQSQDALAAFLTLTDRSLIALKPEHPGLLLTVMLLAGSADDVANKELAFELNKYALEGYQKTYGVNSHHTAVVRFQNAVLAQHAGDYVSARGIARSLIDLPDTITYKNWIERAYVLAALVGDENVTDAQLKSIEVKRLAAFGVASMVLADTRLDLAAIAIKRKQWQRARTLLDLTEAVVSKPNGAGLAPMYWLQRANLATLAPAPDLNFAALARARMVKLLGAQQRQLFDPVSANWVGLPVPDAAQRSAQLKHAAQRIYARRANSEVKF